MNERFWKGILNSTQSINNYLDFNGSSTTGIYVPMYLHSYVVEIAWIVRYRNFWQCTFFEKSCDKIHFVIKCVLENTWCRNMDDICICLQNDDSRKYRYACFYGPRTIDFSSYVTYHTVTQHQVIYCSIYIVYYILTFSYPWLTSFEY
jgi:hypothetical protein